MGRAGQGGPGTLSVRPGRGEADVATDPGPGRGGVRVPDDLFDSLASVALLLARRFHAGATLWCTSPAWPQHAEHVAVEFVHPVVVGKPALPAVAVGGDDATAVLRTLVEAGDVILTVADGTDRVARDLALRAPAWGATTIWVGRGSAPADVAECRLVWFGEASDAAAFDGTFVLAYHVLWELTHVCLEHPGVLGQLPAPSGDTCVSCSDEAVTAEVTGVGDPTTATVRTPAGWVEVDTTLVGPVAGGDMLLVHAGVAISRLDLDGPDALAVIDRLDEGAL